MNTNSWYGHFVFFLNKTQLKTCFACGLEGFSIRNFHIYFTVCRKIRNESLHVLLIAWALSSFILIQVDEGLIYHGSKWNDIYVCILKPCVLYKCSIFTFIISYDSKLQSFQLFITTNVVLLAHYRSHSPLSHTNCTFPICTSLKSSTYLLIPVLLLNTWRTFLLLSIVIWGPIQFNQLSWQMKVYLNLQAAALIIICLIYI